MNLLFLGDVVGEIGSEFVGEKLGGLKKFYNAEIVIVNGENSANGNGITPHSAKYLFSRGADIITTGNHCYRRREIYDTREKEERLLRPANFPEGNPGHGVCLYDMGKCTIAVINLMGTVYMEALDNPFATVDRLLGEIDTPHIFVDFHAEATSEKLALAYYLDGRVQALWGTHTHVPTADCQILPGGTGFVTDLGMTGPVRSVLGIRPDQSINIFRGGLPQPYKVAEGPYKLNAVLFTIDTDTGKCTAVERVDISEL